MGLLLAASLLKAVFQFSAMSPSSTGNLPASGRARFDEDQAAVKQTA
jgi:hypothetical protein